MAFFLSSIGLIIALAALVYAVHHNMKRRLRHGRADLGSASLAGDLLGKTETELVADFANAVATAYGLDPGILRPSDTLEMLNAIDSWLLGEGFEDVQEWLHSRGYQMELSPAMSLGSIVDELVKSAKMTSAEE